MATWTIAATAPNVIPDMGILAGGERTQDNSERSLVQKAQVGGPQSFAALFQLHKNRV